MARGPLTRRTDGPLNHSPRGAPDRNQVPARTGPLGRRGPRWRCCSSRHSPSASSPAEPTGSRQTPSIGTGWSGGASRESRRSERPTHHWCGDNGPGARVCRRAPGGRPLAHLGGGLRPRAQGHLWLAGGRRPYRRQPASTAAGPRVPQPLVPTLSRDQLSRLLGASSPRDRLIISRGGFMRGPVHSPQRARKPIGFV